MDEQVKPGYRRVTEILSAQTGYGSVPAKILQNACDRGTRVHLAISNFLTGLGMWHDEPEDLPYLESFEKFWKAWDFTALEQRFYCDDLLITGQCDVIIKYDDKPVLIDWKTSYAVNPTWAYQGAAYHYLAKGYDLHEIWFVQLSKKGDEPKVFRFSKSECEANMIIFKKCIEIYDVFHAKKKTINYDEL